MARNGRTYTVDATQATTGNIAGRIGDSCYRVASSLEQVADRAVESAEQTATLTSVAAILAGSLAGVATVATIGHFYLDSTKLTHLGSEDIKTI